MQRSHSFHRSKPDVLVGSQLRAARALLDWSIPVAAERCGIGANTIRRFEKGERSPGEKILEAIVRGFEECRVLFIDTDSGAGVLLVDPPAVSLARRSGNAED